MPSTAAGLSSRAGWWQDDEASGRVTYTGHEWDGEAGLYSFYYRLPWHPRSTA